MKIAQDVTNRTIETLWPADKSRRCHGGKAGVMSTEVLQRTEVRQQHNKFLKQVTTKVA